MVTQLDPWQTMLARLKNLSTGVPENFKNLWQDLRGFFDDPRLEELRNAYRVQQKEHKKELEILKSGGESLECRIGALRALAQLEPEEYSKDLLNLVADETQDVDFRAWALYDLLLTGFTLNADNWKSDGTRILRALDDPQAKVRQWAAYLLGEMARKQGDQHKTKLEGETAHKEAEKALRTRWAREIDLYVDRQLVMSLGLVGGWDLSTAATDPEQRCPIAEVLSQAAEHVNGEVRRLVPDSVAAVARNVAAREIGPELKAKTYDQLAQVISAWLKRCLDDHKNKHDASAGPCDCYDQVVMALTRLTSIWDASRQVLSSQTDFHPLLYEEHGPLLACPRQVLETPGLTYDSYRLAISTVVYVIQGILPSHEALAQKGILLLCECIEPGAPSPKRPLVDDDDVRARALQAFSDLAEPSPQQCSGCVKKVHSQLAQLAVPRLKEMLADPSDRVWQRAADALVILMEYKEAVEFFTAVVLKDEKAEAALQHRRDTWAARKESRSGDMDLVRVQVKKRAAQALNAVAQQQRPASGEPEAYAELLSALSSYKEPEHKYAHDAFESIGGRKGVQALVQSDLRTLVEDKYFSPIAEAERKGNELLAKMVGMSQCSYGFTLVMAIVVGLAGAALLWVSISRMIVTKSSEWKDLVPVLSGLILAIASILAPFFWSSAQAVQKTTGQMANLIAAFHGYLGRVRLVGLSFAHAFSKDGEDQLHADFASAMSSAVGQAILDSSRVLESIGRGPLVEPILTSVPNFVGETRTSAMTLASGKTLALVFRTENNEAAKDTILTQDVRAGTEVKPGTTIGIAVSLGPVDS